MRILLLTQWYPPEPGRLLQELAQTLQARGHEVTILTGFPNYPSGQLYPGYRLRPCQRESLAGVPVIRVPLFMDHSQSSAKRVMNYVSFALSSSILGFWLVPRADVIFVYHPPTDDRAAGLGPQPALACSVRLSDPRYVAGDPERDGNGQEPSDLISDRAVCPVGL